VNYIICKHTYFAENYVDPVDADFNIRYIVTEMEGVCEMNMDDESAFFKTGIISIVTEQIILYDG